MNNGEHCRKKAPRFTRGAFFCALTLLFPPAWADCVLGQADELVAVERVQDGDTLLLEDGRRVRLIGVNTPEMPRKGEPGEPLAQAATDFTERFLDGGGVELVYDRARRDRYGRVLAHVYNHRGESLEAALLSAGLAFHIAIAPNLALAECLHTREEWARRAGRGIWAAGTWPRLRAGDVRPGDGGFVLLRGRVEKVDRNHFLWLELDGPVAIRLDPTRDYGQVTGRDWQDREIEVKGWLVDRGTKYLSLYPQNKRWFIAADSEFTIEISRD
ncbi:MULTISPECIES: thermonuclease family protein [Microbulbifer]|uniref:thermonuclease family protein n=1 Tax=Microbulbifer TaxID=48073 RepID=UPI001E41BBED|nr:MULTISPECIES: thermonuclease family protein [Microbulbifer]UHQ53871.1 thermonuclease family protein [Microbulbifer sp. YPW16]